VRRWPLARGTEFAVLILIRVFGYVLQFFSQPHQECFRPRLVLLSYFPTTHALVDDWFNHANYLFFFLFGALIAPSEKFWQQVAQLRKPSLLIALAAWLFLSSYYAYSIDARPAPDYLRLIQRVVWVSLEWTAILAACGFARIYLQKDNAMRPYLTQAVVPVYIFHQTLIVVVSHSLKPLDLPPVAEAPFLIIATLLLSFTGAVHG
jgi:glucan biosynthesis protein C